MPVSTECYRVLRPGHWLLLIFMNSSSQVWEVLRSAIGEAGFVIRKADTFDKQHATFKQLVSENTAGCDLVLHCWKPTRTSEHSATNGREKGNQRNQLFAFLASANIEKRRQTFLHVSRPEEIDFRAFYSEWLAHALPGNSAMLDFAEFRRLAQEWIAARSGS